MCLVVRDLLTPSLAISDTVHMGANALNCLLQAAAGLLDHLLADRLGIGLEAFPEAFQRVSSSKRPGSWVKVVAKARNSITFASAAGAAALLGKSGPKLSNSRMASLRRFHAPSCATFFLAASSFGKKVRTVH